MYRCWIAKEQVKRRARYHHVKREGERYEYNFGYYMQTQ